MTHEIIRVIFWVLAWSLEIQITLDGNLRPSIKVEGVRVLAESFGVSLYVSAGARGSLRPHNSARSVCRTKVLARKGLRQEGKAVVIL